MDLSSFLDTIRRGDTPKGETSYAVVQKNVLLLTKHSDFFKQGEVFTDMMIKIFKDVDGVWTLALVRSLPQQRVNFEKNRLPIYAGTVIVDSFIDDNRHVIAIKHIDLWRKENLVVSGDEIEYFAFNEATLVGKKYFESDHDGFKPLYMRLFSPDLDYKNFPKWQRSSSQDFDNALISVSEETSDFCNAVGSYDRFFNLKSGREVVSNDKESTLLVFTEELRGKIGTALIYDMANNHFATVNLTQYEDKNMTVLFYNNKEYFVERGLSNVSSKSKPYTFVIETGKDYEAG